MEAYMKPIIVSTQAQYNEAEKLYWKTLDKSHFDIDRGKGMEIVEETDYLIHNFLYGDASKENTENDLSRFYFNKSQAEEITGYFLTHLPGDLYNIERGLNLLNMRADEGSNNRFPLIHIKNGIEKISVLCPVEVFGESEIEAFGRAIVTARDKSRITAHDRVIVKALDNAQVAAHNQSHIIAKNCSSITLYGNSTAAVHNNAHITAMEDSKIAVFDQANATVLDTARADVYDHTLIFAKNDSKINAFNNATVNAYDDSRIAARNTAYIVAGGSASIDALNYAVIVAGDKAKVTANHHSLVFLKHDATCETKDKAYVITKSQNQPAFLENNVFRLLDHPFIDQNPAIAVNLLLSSSNPGDREAFSRKLKEMGCIDPESTNRVLQSLANKLNRTPHIARDRDSSWER
jgi:hypothetical protein